MRRTAIALVIAGIGLAVATPYIAIAVYRSYPGRSFDRSEWLQSRWYGCRADNPRSEMLSSVREKLEGLTRKEVLHALGAPAERHSLPPKSYGWVTGEHMGCEILLVIFSDAGVVEDSTIVYS